MLTIHEETGCLPGERQDLQDTKQQSQAEILPLLEKKWNLSAPDPIV